MRGIALLSIGVLLAACGSDRGRGGGGGGGGGGGPLPDPADQGEEGEGEAQPAGEGEGEASAEGEGEGAGEGEGEPDPPLEILCGDVRDVAIPAGRCGEFRQRDAGLVLSGAQLEAPVVLAAVFSGAMARADERADVLLALQIDETGGPASLVGSFGWAAECGDGDRTLAGAGQPMEGDLGQGVLQFIADELTLDMPGAGRLRIWHPTVTAPPDGGPGATLRGFLLEADAADLCAQDGDRTWGDLLTDTIPRTCGDERCWLLDLPLVAAPARFVTDEAPEDPPAGDCPASQDEFMIGPDVGQRIPDLTLRDADGDSHTLYELCGGEAVVIVSGAMWDVSTRTLMFSLMGLAPQWAEAGVSLYLSVFENEERLPPSDDDLRGYEELLGAEPPLRILKDPGLITALYRNSRESLPFVVMVDRQMVVEEILAAPEIEEITDALGLGF